MIPEVGHFSLILSFCLALASGPILLYSARLDDEATASFGRRACMLVFILVAVAFGTLMTSFATSDFSVENVFENSHTAKPLLFKFTGTWGNHEGSMLLWVLVLTLFSAVLALRYKAVPRDLHGLTLGVQALIVAAFLAFILFTSNPFNRLLPTPADGIGLNPLLQDVGLAIHPPFLYLGYVGFSIPFSFAVAALIRGKADTVWARLVRPWALAAWCFLTIGIVLGSWWAYYELGWGGWWAWDPVENASFMPWLAGVALIHTIRVVERRDALKGWAVLLAIATFSLSLVGTFLVRSGVLTSVHAFATDPTRGVFILMILLIVVGGSLTLYAIRGAMLSPTGVFTPVSREGALVLNNVLLTSACATVFVGTFYPLFVDILSGEKLSVGAPYFNAVFSPLAAAMMFFAAVGALLAWKKAPLNATMMRMRFVSGAAVVAGLVVALTVDRNRLIGAGLIGLIVWLIGGVFVDLASRTGLFRMPIARSFERLRGLPRSAIGVSLAHGGLALFALGVAGVSLWKTEEIFLMNPGQKVDVAGYEISLNSVEIIRGANFEAEQAKFNAIKNGREIALSGERRFYPVRRMQTTEAAIRAQRFGDVYITFGENADGRGWPVRVYFNPLVGCLWWGAAIAVLGGFLGLTDRGKIPAKKREEALATNAAGAGI